MLDELLRFNYKQKYLVIDCETCGLGLGNLKNFGWQWSFLACEGINILEEHDYLLKWPNLVVGTEAAKITHFDQRKVDEHGKDPKEIMLKLDSYINNPEFRIISHNWLNFDGYIRRLNHLALDIPHNWDYLPRILDTNALSRTMKMNIPIDRENLLTFQFKLANTRQKGVKTSLGTMAKEFGIPYDIFSAHNGIYDVNLNWGVWNKLKFAIEI